MGSPALSTRQISGLLLRACHDLRSPLRGIRAHSELLLRDAQAVEPVDFARRLGFLVDGARKLDLLVDGIAIYAIALDTGAGSFQTLSTGVLLRGALAKLAPLLRESGAEVTHDELPRVRGNPDRLIQVFEQLIRNAFGHRGEAAPRVHIGAAIQADGSWLFAVRDNGPGVEASELERIFQPFERLNGDGPGLGLAICRAIVEGHGGKIWAESQAGKGSTFFFTLPEQG